MPQQVDEERQLFSRGYSQHLGTVHPKMKTLSLITDCDAYGKTGEVWQTTHFFKSFTSNIAVFSLTTEVAGDLL